MQEAEQIEKKLIWLSKNVLVDVRRLNQQMDEQSYLTNEAGDLFARAKNLAGHQQNVLDALKQKVKLIRASARLRIKLNPELYIPFEGLTLDDFAAAVETDKEVVQHQDKINNQARLVTDLIELQDRCKAMMQAMQHRKNMLEARRDIITMILSGRINNEKLAIILQKMETEIGTTVNEFLKE